MSNVVLQAEAVEKSYFLGGKELAVLQGVSLELQAGEFVALQGASGSGKSTLLQLLGGLDRPTVGTIRFDGDPLRVQTPTQAAKFRGSHVGFVFQAYHLLPDLDALENVLLPAQVQRRPQAASEQRARDLLDSVGLSDRMDHRPSELSGGEQQRVAIARALMNEPEIVLADEPTGNLDRSAGEEIMGIIHDLNSSYDVTIVMVTHDMSIAAQADRTVRLAEGRVESVSFQS